MSLCIYARIQNECLKQELLDKSIHDYFSPQSKIMQNKQEISYKIINDRNDVIISFVQKKTAPYNVYDSDIIGNEFEFSQLIIFDINKETSSTAEYKEIIKFCKYLKKKIDSSVLITSDMHDEICYLKENKIIWSDDKEKIFS